MTKEKLASPWFLEVAGLNHPLAATHAPIMGHRMWTKKA